MTMDPEMHETFDIYDKMNEICIGRQNVDVMYAIAMMIAQSIAINSSTTDLDKTINILRKTIDLELKAHAAGIGRLL